MATTITQSTGSANPVSSPRGQLKFASAFTIAFGLMMALGSHTSTDWPVRTFTDLLFWPLDDTAVLSDEAQLLAAILGGVMAGFGVLFWMLTDELADTRPELLKRLVLVTFAVWFVVDSTGSIASGAWLNAVANVGFLALFAVPALRL